MKFILALILLLAFSLSSCCSIPNYRISKSDYSQSSIIKSITDKNSSFNAYVYRAEPGDYYYDIINLAESLYLPSKVVMGEKNQFSADSLNASANEEDIWWRDNFDGIKIPYCLTKSAVNYYSELIEAFRKNDQEKLGVKSQNFAEFSYVAEIRQKLVYERNGYVFKDKDKLFIVTMTMEWESRCGDLCGLKFTKERIVIIDSSGKVLAVFGDGPVETWVS